MINDVKKLSLTSKGEGCRYKGKTPKILCVCVVIIDTGTDYLCPFK